MTGCCTARALVRALCTLRDDVHAQSAWLAGDEIALEGYNVIARKGCAAITVVLVLLLHGCLFK